ncbi:hypothetical protein QYE76_024638 [Lolium multiflorum]|uniref:Retrotransposon gag domain-containing protein n=1 Tax=Lolium multiflorum TaxID=4521 RepID=A0AAD8REA7_LOLMU|nr:hypothetical protein QYE76_024638 [Lolium multiflorum]
MAEDTPVTYADLPDELKKKHDEIKATLEAELVGSFHRTRSYGVLCRYLAQLGTISASDELRVRFFSQSLTGSAFGWYTSLPPNSIQTWKQLEEQFHEQYHSEASESSIADLTQLRQKRGEPPCNTQGHGLPSRLSLAGARGSKLSAYEQRHPDLYQDKFKRAVALVDAEEDGSCGDQEVAVASGLGEEPRVPQMGKATGPPVGFDFDVTKTEQIFDLLLKEKR